MSTKTTIKRIALVAAVAAAFGGLSTVASNAAAGLANFTLGGAASGAGYQSTTATANATVGTYESVVLTFASETDKVATITSAGVGTIAVPSIAATGSNALATTGITTTGVTVYGTGTLNDVPGTTHNVTLGTYSLSFSAYSATAGTQTITLADTTGTSTATITWGAAPVFSLGNSPVIFVETSTATSAVNAAITARIAGGTTTDSSAAVSKSAGYVGVVRASLFDNESPAVALAGKTVSATITGAGLLIGQATADAAAAAGSVSAVASSVVDSSGFADFYVYSSGAAGTATITVSYTDGSGNTTVLGTKSVVFYNTTPAKFTTVQNLYVGTAGQALGESTTGGDQTTAAHTAAALVYAQDASGNPVGGLHSVGTWSATSSNTNVISSTLAATPVEDTDATYGEGTGYYIVQPQFAAGATAGSSATLTVKWTSADGLTVITAPAITFTVGATLASTVAFTTDEASYAPGQQVVLTATVKDAAGNAVADGTYNVFAAPATGTTVLTPSAALTSSPFASSTGNVLVVNGVATAKFYAPYTDGSVILSGTTGTTGLVPALQATAIKVTFDVATGASAASSAATDAANEATDAANAATDAANAAADAADAATQAAQDASAQAQAALAAVNALSAKITVLAAQIAKIVKKLGA